MGSKLRLLLTGLTVTAVAPVIHATQQAYSPMAGGLCYTIPAGTEPRLSIPFERRTELTSRIAAVQPDRLALLDVVGILDGTLAPASGPTHYLQFASGQLAGLVYPIVSHSGGTFILDTKGDNLTAHGLGSIASGVDVVRIRPAWNMGTFMGSPSTSNGFADAALFDAPGVVYTEGDALLLADQSTVATDKEPVAYVSYVWDQGWRASDKPSENAAYRVIMPGHAFGVRRYATTDLSLFVLGYIPVKPGVLRLPNVAANEEMDFSVGLMRPGRLALSGSGLNNVFKSSGSSVVPGDTILEYPGSAKGLDMSPSRRLQLVGGNWTDAGVQLNAHELKAGQGYVLRLRGEPASRFWKQTMSTTE